MIKIILAGTFIVAALLFALLLVSAFVIQNPNLISRTILGASFLIYVALVAICVHKHRYKFAAWMLLLLYSSIALIVMFYWGINAPVGVILLGFAILLSGIMLGSRYIIPVTAFLMLCLFVIFILDIGAVHKPNYSALSLAAGFGDVGTYVTIFGIFALIAWLSTNRMEQSLIKARSAESALEKEKLLLSKKLAEQIKIVRKSQQEEIMQLYRFAELGQLTTIILHEMANNLSILSLDIDDIHKENKTSEAIVRTKESIRYLEGMVRKIRRQLNNTDHTTRFNTNEVVTNTLNELLAKAKKSGITINSSLSKEKLYIIGDPLRLSQILTILVNNALDASTSTNSLKEIFINVESRNNKIEISVIDYGVGIPKESRGHLFEPLHSSKQNGLGIGLFVAKQIAETHFKGTIKLDSSLNRTEFIIQLPKR